MSERKRTAVRDVQAPAVRGPRHGLPALKAAIRIKGLGAIDRRTAGAQALLVWKKTLIADLGGEQAVTAGQRALVDLAAQTKLLVDHADAALFSLPRLVNRRGRMIPLVEQRQRLADTLARVLGQLGLERRAPPDGLAGLLAAEREHGAGS